MRKEIKNLPASVLDRLRNKARESGLPYDWLLQNHANERFLYRLSQSDHCQKFVLKGGLIFIGWRTPLRRHTKDIDLRAYTSNTIDNIVPIIQDVCTQPVDPDGIKFDPSTVGADYITEHVEYSGIRVRFWARIGEKTRIRMQIDIGFSDEITPPANLITYPSLLDMPAPYLYGYPKETVVAEKLQSIVRRGSATSRRKDFYDLWFTSRNFDYEGALLQDAITRTFQNRETQIPVELPAVFSDSYAEKNERQWQAFLSTFNPGDIGMNSFTEVISILRKFLAPVMKAIVDGTRFDLYWKAGEKWNVTDK